MVVVVEREVMIILDAYGYLYIQVHNVTVTAIQRDDVRPTGATVYLT